uniref:PsbP C-terminal domain-containing protein n=1 Tax=Grammatophora oceanica TaxID=210454 RepID=A0A7S1YEI7_9STRA|mmetsp:Transcript_46367/g.69039  ORF Transcript_46367/g.69039 Transcript_46367/m.69039 type:complete len:247 (+) Transcript_46367:108-848(+)|eukprot:CAMPEP_0194029392 /NCGR_PEP_ID=MMETSP0009_2-20130614/3120_1 /TAXON_ID=210454 /ORGANISM="Grammatophora oceanica, Strain CCMP 410" /LENGTH=246 /DNA_ID=CAMNT_0038669039 /DNA_START=87 /DNA_END=827 /DNA_ORIENTATION=-
MATMRRTDVALVALCSVLFVFLTPAANAFVVAPSRAASAGGVAIINHQRSSSYNYNPASKSTSALNAQKPSLQHKIGTAVVGAMLFFSTLAGGPALPPSTLPPPAFADSSRVVGELQGSGLIFKDTLEIESFDDPKVKGVTLYISNFQRPLTERLTSDFLSDPSYASVGCAKTGPVTIADNIAKGKGGEEVFEESKSLLFKTLRVQRIYDEQKKTVIYVSFNTRFDKSADSNKSRFKSSICAVALE